MAICDPRKQVAHWARAGCSVHKNGRFRGWEDVLEIAVQKKGCISGREAVFKVGVQENGRFSGRDAVFRVGGQEKGRFSGRQGGRQKRDTLERMSP